MSYDERYSATGGVYVPGTDYTALEKAALDGQSRVNKSKYDLIGTVSMNSDGRQTGQGGSFTDQVNSLAKSGMDPAWDERFNRLEDKLNEREGPAPWVSAVTGIGGLATGAYNAINNRKVQKEQIKGLKQNRQFAQENQQWERERRERLARQGEAWNRAWN